MNPKTVRRTAAVGLVLAVLAGTAVALQRDPRRTVLEVLPTDMVRSRALRAGDVRTDLPLRALPAARPDGAVARDDDLDVFGASLEEAARAGRELTAPPPSAALRARGAVVWANVCAACHGAAGLGDAPVTKKGFPPPPTLRRPDSRALKDGEIWHAVVHGRRNMPSVAAQVAPADRWAVVAHVRSLMEVP
ncbi:MAG: cytochrome c [Planctomycetes bacterium]|nr:cytochrome c [Planctomycetota bacterium]